MQTLFRKFTHVALFCFLSIGVAVEGQESSATELAGQLGTAVVDGDSVTRLRISIEPTGGGEKTVMQVQVKARRAAGKTEVVYQLLWPKDRMGESFLITKNKGSAAEGTSFQLPQTVTPLNAAQMKGAVFGSDLAYQDVVENFFEWEHQALVGKETIDRVDCLILESKPGENDSTPYRLVRSWIDPKKRIAMRVEKYDSTDKLVCRIDTARVAKTDQGKDIPASLIVRRSGSGTVTELEGSNIRHDVKFADRDFTVPAMADLTIPR